MVEDAWKNFELSGKISDYLTYRQSMQAKDAGRQTMEETARASQKKGKDGYGRAGSFNGDGVKCHADWRI